MSKRKKDDIEKKMTYFQDHKFKCPKCDYKVLIRYDQESKICRWCGTRVFKDKEKEKKYYFDQQLRRAMAKRESNESISNN